MLTCLYFHFKSISVNCLLWNILVVIYDLILQPNDLEPKCAATSVLVNNCHILRFWGHTEGPWKWPNNYSKPHRVIDILWLNLWSNTDYILSLGKHKDSHQNLNNPHNNKNFAIDYFNKENKMFSHRKIKVVTNWKLP